MIKQTGYLLPKLKPVKTRNERHYTRMQMYLQGKDQKRDPSFYNPNYYKGATPEEIETVKNIVKENNKKSVGKNIGKLNATMSLKVNLTLWAAIKIRIAGISNLKTSWNKKGKK